MSGVWYGVMVVFYSLFFFLVMKKMNRCWRCRCTMLVIILDSVGIALIYLLFFVFQRKLFILFISTILYN